eukprot:CAMPEP_0175653890 /NCGR_PEP_ID=MMETSP0097-20121207/11118_1 /TAXON_ID=311494 /ORGANISM="Alexandrium monilatum, Strain CCMP3105" /LENGTH=140 /DNA_ID=CAMNT_0016959929 /DNA_START=63 /DNA_END=482 /DNA_ORIENTATION=+
MARTTASTRLATEATFGRLPQRVAASSERHLAVLGDRLRPLGNRMLGELPGKHEPHSGLHLSAREGPPLHGAQQSRRLGCHAVKYIVHEAVHDVHPALANATLRVDLLQHLVDVDGVGLRLLPGASPLWEARRLWPLGGL